MAWLGPIERVREALREMTADADEQGCAYVRGVVIGLGGQEVVVQDDATVRVNGEYVPLCICGGGVLITCL